MYLGGFFVSFMSGNSTRLAVGAAHNLAEARIAFGLIAGFVGGVVIGSLTGRVARARRQTAVLLLVSGLLAAAAMLGGLGLPGTALALVLAMGAENTVFEHDGEVRIGLTYMTGTLVKCGQRIAAALRGGDKFGWLPFLSMWLSLLCGAVAGAAIFPRLGLSGLWIAAAVALVSALFAAAFLRDEGLISR
jgi:uncharacterized membrane protein YoaK (UPF0700 family)